MIHIPRGSAPAFLQSEKVIAAKEKLVRSFHNAQRQERFRFEVSLLGEVKNELMKMCTNKCAYCESRLGVISYGDVENFRPKSGARGIDKEYAPMHYWWLAYEWDNLLITCQICNQKYKRDYFPVEDENNRAAIGATGAELLKENALLIDPSLENPQEHLEFLKDGTVIEVSKKGKVSIELLGLNRKDLVETRLNTSTILLTRLMTLSDTSDISGHITSDLVAYIKELFSDHPPQEYAAMLRTTFDTWYEENASLWEEAKQFHNDESNTKRRHKKIVETSEAAEISKAEHQLSTIKRFSIKSVDIENFKSIEKINLNLLPVNEKESRESWLLLLGDNGIGKSSILQAIALALAGKKQIKKLNLDVTDYLRKGADKGKVVIQSFEHDKPVELHFDATGFKTDLEEAPGFVLAYGSTRLLPKGKILPDRKKEPYLNIRNLFDYSVALNDPNTWLKKVSPVEFKDRVAPALFDLLALRKDDRVWINENEISIHQYGDDHELDNNSDGYKGIVALASDMMQTLSTDSANYHNSQGIVLIDELGNHLHPRWRMKIVNALRKAFPKLQFIVTSHEPLCLRGLSHGEVAVLVRDQQNKIRSLDSKFLPDHSLLRIDQLLTSDLFGLVNIYDDETEKTYEEYYSLLSKKETERTEEEKIKIKEFSSTLSKKELLGSTPQLQAMYEMFNETYAQKIREEGFKTKEELKQETITEVKDLLTKKNVSWL